MVGGSHTFLDQTGSFAYTANTWYTVSVGMVGTTMTVTINGVDKWKANDATLAGTKLGIKTWYSDASFDDVKVRRLVATEPTMAMGNEEGRPAANVTKYYYASGKRIAMRRGDPLSYIFADHLGGTSVVLNASTGVSNTIFFYPFEGTRAGSVPTDYTYTGQKADDSTGLLFYGARYYDSAIGRFASADNIVPGKADPQAFNRYAYALNNPVKYRDPSGHWVETAWDVANIAWDLYEFKQDPSFINGAALVVDAATVILPLVPAFAGLLIRGGKVAKGAVEVGAHADDVADAARLGWRATEFAKVSHLKGADTLLNKLLHSSPQVAKGAEYELEFAVGHVDEIEEIGRVLEVIDDGKKEIDFVTKGNVFVNVKSYDWTKYNDTVLKFETDAMVKQATDFFEYKPDAVKYVFKGGVPDSVRRELEAANIIVEVWP